MAGNYERMLDYYPLLIESAIDFKIESRKILAKHNGKYLDLILTFVLNKGVAPEINENVETCHLARGYRITKHQNTFICLKDG